MKVWPVLREDRRIGRGSPPTLNSSNSKAVISAALTPVRSSTNHVQVAGISVNKEMFLFGEDGVSAPEASKFEPVPVADFSRPSRPSCPTRSLR